MRVISLVPSVTETLSTWGCTPVACTRFCERADLEHVGGTKDPDVAHVASLEPDLVVVDAEENRREDYEDMVRRGLSVHVLRVRSLGDLNASMDELARRVGATWSSLALAAPLPTRARAFVPIWRRPWMALGSPTYGSSLLAHLGVVNVFDDAAYPEVTVDEVTARRPDLVVAPSEPYPFSTRQLGELEVFAPAMFVDGKDLFWWGSRTAGAMERLAEQFALRVG